ncbi:Arc family DNA-binding protein [Ensifer sp. NPDC090286]|uniref:Arc family DNA-binding protein n=1 Tax=Ensifer sp. NPDC090286 TaxID=3363991 RepID=UPI00383BB9F5
MENVKRSSLTLRLPAPLRDWLAAKAKENFTSLNDEIIRLIREGQEKEKGEAPA